MKSSKFNIPGLLGFFRRIRPTALSFMQRIFLGLINSWNKYKNILLKIVLPILIVGIGYYTCSSSQSVISKNIDEIFFISDNVRAYYADKPGFWGVSTQSLIDNKIIPDKFVHQNKIILHGKTEILIGHGEEADAVMPLEQYFDIVMPRLNKAQCMSYAETSLLPENNLKVYSIRIINTLGDYLFEWGGNRPLPIEKYATKDLCIDGQNTLIWSIR